LAESMSPDTEGLNLRFKNNLLLEPLNLRILEPFLRKTKDKESLELLGG